MKDWQTKLKVQPSQFIEAFLFSFKQLLSHLASNIYFYSNKIAQLLKAEQT